MRPAAPPRPPGRAARDRPSPERTGGDPTTVPPRPSQTTRTRHRSAVARHSPCARSMHDGRNAGVRPRVPTSGV